MATQQGPRVSVDRRVRAGRLVIRGTRVPVDVVAGQLAAGVSVDQVRDDYGITRDVLAALAVPRKVDRWP